jgi:hypothetical protein
MTAGASLRRKNGEKRVRCFPTEPPVGICRAAHVPINSQTTTSLLEVAHGCFDNAHMQARKDTTPFQLFFSFFTAPVK